MYLRNLSLYKHFESFGYEIKSFLYISANIEKMNIILESLAEDIAFGH
jgi:hypothetical protein